MCVKCLSEKELYSSAPFDRCCQIPTKTNIRQNPSFVVDGAKCLQKKEMAVMRHIEAEEKKNIFKIIVFVLDSYQVLMYIRCKCLIKIMDSKVFMIIEAIREHIRKCGKSRYRISQDTGIDEAALCRMMQGAGCNVETADILCKYFGLELVEKKSEKKAR